MSEKEPKLESQNAPAEKKDTAAEKKAVKEADKAKKAADKVAVAVDGRTKSEKKSADDKIKTDKEKADEVRAERDKMNQARMDAISSEALRRSKTSRKGQVSRQIQSCRAQARRLVTREDVKQAKKKGSCMTEVIDSMVEKANPKLWKEFVKLNKK